MKTPPENSPLTVPTDLERLTFRHSPKFTQFHNKWNSSASRGKNFNHKDFVGDINLLLMFTKPQSLQEWADAYVARIGMQRLTRHAQLLSHSTAGELTPQEALTFILVHTVDETWAGWVAKLQAHRELNRQAAMRTASSVVEDLIAAAEEHEGRTLNVEEVSNITEREIVAVLRRGNSVRFPTLDEFTRWGVSLVEERSGLVTGGFWVRPSSFFALGASLQTKEWEARKVQVFRTYQRHATGTAVDASFLAYSPAADGVHSFTTLHWADALAEVMHSERLERNELAGSVHGAEGRSAPGEQEISGATLRAVSPQELQARKQEELHQQQLQAHNLCISNQRAAAEEAARRLF